MKEGKSKLLCTFTNRSNLYKTIKKIENECNLVNDKVYVLEDVDNQNELLITYNVYEFDGSLPQTVFVHRKKETNTVYSLNAMNEIIKEMNNGKLDESFEVPWEEYKNSFLILRGEEKELHKINTQLFSVMNIN